MPDAVIDLLCTIERLAEAVRRHVAGFHRCLGHGCERRRSGVRRAVLRGRRRADGQHPGGADRLRADLVVCGGDDPRADQAQLRGVRE
ncbi:hypothetical protein [Streptomyces sp. NBC_00057]|uniref:hypothetical protein n=1 Tax=Streptomyces sp. NBC_00057 TaxID=2975634 RepID=UPI0032469F85